MSEVENIKIGKKRPTAYVSAGEYGISKHGEIKLLARGNNIPRAIIVGEMLRKKIPNVKYVVEIDTEEHDEKIVPTIEIGLKAN